MELKQMRQLTSNAQKIRDFQNAIGDPIPPQPRLPDPATLALRQTLIREEYEEVMEAFEQLQARETQPAAEDLAELVHELTDLLYVAYGAIVACGVDPDAVFAEVHRANMQKARAPRRPDGKVLKPKNFRPANVAAVIAKQHNGY